MEPSSPFFDIHVYIGMDKVWSSPGHLWKASEQQVFQSCLENTWVLMGHAPDHLHVEWIDCQDPYFQMSISSLETYCQENKLDPYWFQYLVHRSGSCIEYAQVSTLYQVVLSRHQPFHDNDLLLRTRTDVLWRYPLHLQNIPSGIVPTKEVFSLLFPNCQDTLCTTSRDREASFFSSRFEKDKWVIVLRKNLLYMMPLKAGKVLLEVSKYYGDWDGPELNPYWFNAESQFRGCLRRHQFTLWDFSQEKDECFGLEEFDHRPEDFPFYAILRM